VNKCKSIAVTVQQYGEKHGGITCREMIVRKVSFKFMLNVDSVTDDVTSDGRLFQVFAAATQNARSPTVWRCVCGTARSADDAERKRCRPGRSANAVDCQSYMLVRDPSHNETRKLPDWTIFALVHKANADSEVEAKPVTVKRSAELSDEYCVVDAESQNRQLQRLRGATSSTHQRRWLHVDAKVDCLKYEATELNIVDIV